MSQEQTESQAERIAATSDDVHRRTRDLVVDLFRKGGESIGRLPGAVTGVIEGAWRGVGEVAQDKRADVFREVIDGLAEGVSRGASAVKYTLEEAKSRGQSFAEQDLKGTAEDLRTIEFLLVDRVESLVKSSASLTADQTRDVLKHTHRAAASIRPQIESAISAAAAHPIGLAKETTTVAAGVARKAAGTLLAGIAGALEGLGEVVSGSRDAESKEHKDHNADSPT